ncbi:hypothetical protein [Empedobacter brevis]|uniref:hypothetical protein n=1 Tax=Empedobacter brevis TaxID=247 RepID=UPI0033411B51
MTSADFIWRTELYHAISVHFPIALLSLSAVTGLLYLVLRKKKIAGYLRFTTSFLLWIGFGCFWISFYTGNNAYPIVVRELCDPTVLKDHLYWVQVSGYLFGAAFLADVVYHCLKEKRFKTVANSVMLVGLLAGTATLAYAGHLGASVVYEQAGGVNVPTADCDGF